MILIVRDNISIWWSRIFNFSFVSVSWDFKIGSEGRLTSSSNSHKSVTRSHWGDRNASSDRDQHCLTLSCTMYSISSITCPSRDPLLAGSGDYLENSRIQSLFSPPFVEVSWMLLMIMILRDNIEISWSRIFHFCFRFCFMGLWIWLRRLSDSKCKPINL